MKKQISVLLVLSIVLFSGCSVTDKAVSTSGGASTAISSSAPLDLTGKWKQTNSDSSTSYQTATISGNAIEVDWIDKSDDSSSLYWAGSYVAPKNTENDYSWDSKNDKSKTQNSLMASGDDTKTFTYKDGVISYSVSAMGVTKTVKLSRQ